MQFQTSYTVSSHYTEFELKARAEAYRRDFEKRTGLPMAPEHAMEILIGTACRLKQVQELTAVHLAAQKEPWAFTANKYKRICQ